MSPFQWAAIVVLGLLAIRDLARYVREWRRSQLRLLRLGALGAAALAIAFPGAVQGVAELVGIGRGADLVLYLSVLVFLVLIFHLYVRSVRLETRIVAIVRESAIRNATRGTTPAGHSTDDAPDDE